MAVTVEYRDTAVRNEATWERIESHAQPQAINEYTAYVVFNNGIYSALCPELDIATDADTLNDAVFMIRRAVEDALAVARDRRVAVGKNVRDEDVADFLAQHQSGPVPVYSFNFYAAA